MRSWSPFMRKLYRFPVIKYPGPYNVVDDWREMWNIFIYSDILIIHYTSTLFSALFCNKHYYNVRIRYYVIENNIFATWKLNSCVVTCVRVRMCVFVYAVGVALVDVDVGRVSKLCLILTTAVVKSDEIEMISAVDIILFFIFINQGRTSRFPCFCGCHYVAPLFLLCVLLFLGPSLKRDRMTIGRRWGVIFTCSALLITNCS